METFNIESGELQQIVITLTLADKEGTPADLDAYEVYAASAGIINPYSLIPKREAWEVAKNAEGTAYVLTSPGHDIPRGPWRYCIYIRQLATGLEWAAVGGKITLQPRTTEEPGGISPAAYAVQAETAVSGMVHCVLDSSATALGAMVAAAQGAATAAETSATQAAAAVSAAETAAQQATAAQTQVATYAAAATASADRASRLATEAQSAATAAGTAADDATAAKTAAETAAQQATAAQQQIATDSAAATASADRASQQATEAKSAATRAGTAAETAASAQSAAETARDAAVQAAAVYDTHVATLATYDSPGHVKLGDSTTAASGYAAHVAADENGRLAVRRATTSVVGCVKLGTSTQVPDDAGMVGATANGAIAVRKASTNTTTGVGCVRLASSLEDTGDVAVPTASLVNAAISALAARVETLEGANGPNTNVTPTTPDLG